MKNLVILLICIIPLIANSQCLTQQTLTGATSFNCFNSTTLTLGNSQLNTTYYLIDSTTQAIIDGPTTGTGSALTFNTGLITQTTVYQVIASQDTNFVINFDGNDENASIPSNNLLRPGTEITIEAWVNVDDLTTNSEQEIYRKEDGNERHLLSFQNSGTILAFGLATNGVYAELDVPISLVDYENQWVHIAATYDGATKRIYRNGIEIGNVAAVGTMATTGTANSHIGSHNGLNEFLDGQIDELRIWSTARNSVEINNGMNPCFAINTSGLLLYLNMNDASGGTITDQSGNNLDASILQGTTSHSSPNGLWQLSDTESVSNTITVTFTGNPNYIYVDSSATAGANTGGCWQSAFLTVGQALSFYEDGDTILIAEGIYKDGAEMTFADNVTIIGGYPNGGAATPDYQLHPTILDGDSTYRVLHFTGNPIPNNYINLEGLTIQDGVATNGAGLYIYSNEEITLNITNCKFIHHQSISGGYADGAAISTPNLLLTINAFNSEFSHNHASGSFIDGGAIRTEKIYAENCKFNFNQAVAVNAAFGGAILAWDKGKLVDCEVTNNTVTDASGSFNSYGGGLRFNNEIVLINTTVVGNNAPDGHGGVQLLGSVNDTIINSIIFDNTGTVYPNIQLVNTTYINHSLIGGEYPLDPNHVGNINDLAGNFQPNFVNATNFDYTLTDSSLLVDACDPAYLRNFNDTDLSDSVRISNCVIDMGAHEYQSVNITNQVPHVWYVDSSNISSHQDGLSWATAFNTLSDVLDRKYCKSDGDTIRVAQGEYFEGHTLIIDYELTIIGGYPSGGGTTPDKSLYPTFLEGNNTYHLINASFSIFNLQGFCLRYGNANGPGISSIGGALFAEGTTINVYDCIFTDNTANMQGGAINLYNSVANFSKCEITNNSGPILGGGMLVSGVSLLEMEDCIVSNNSSIASGGGIYFSSIGSTLNLNRCTIANNSISNSISFYESFGGGLYCQSSYAIVNSIISDNSIESVSESRGGGAYFIGIGSITNSIISNNSCTDYSFSSNLREGGGCYFKNGIANIKNCLITNNSCVSNNAANESGGGICFEIVTNPEIHNTIVADNFSTNSSEIELYFTTLEIMHSFIKGQNPAGTNNINDISNTFNPMYVNAANDDYHLLPNSQLINAGQDTLLPADVFDLDMDLNSSELVPFDLDSNQRINGCSVDIGPYEYQGDWGAGISDTTLCFDLNGGNLVGSGDSLHWFSDAAMTNLLSTGDTLIENGGAGTYTYYIADSTINCPLQLTDTVTLIIEALPSPNLGIDTSFCAGDSVLLDAGSYTSYLWNTSEVSQNISANTGGSFNVQVTDVNGCQNSDTILVVENTLPTPNLGFDTTICDDANITLSPGTFNSYLWHDLSSNATFFVDGNSLGQGTFIFSTEVTDNNGCQNSDSISITVEICLGVNEVDNEFVVSAYPNPTNGSLTIEVPDNASEVILILRNALGQEMMNMTYSDSNQLNFDIEAEDGVYFLEVSIGDKKEIFTIVKH